MAEMTTPSKSKIITVLLLVAVLAVILLGLYYKSGPVYQEFKNLDLIPMPENFTELYFENASALPVSIAKNEPVSFSFTIHNDEGATTAYPYTAYFRNVAGVKTVLKNGDISLGSDASTTVNVSYIFKTAPGTGTVVVDLTSLNQQIDFLVSNNT
jgi:hypothetical protein